MYHSAFSWKNRKSSEDSQRKLSIKQSVDRLNTTHKLVIALLYALKQQRLSFFLARKLRSVWSVLIFS